MKVRKNRQITLPESQCSIANINPGDEVKVFADREGVISIVKQVEGAACGFLKGINKNTDISEEASLYSAIEQ